MGKKGWDKSRKKVKAGSIRKSGKAHQEESREKGGKTEEVRGAESEKKGEIQGEEK